MNEASISQLYERGLGEYKKGDYFEAHEIWEELWSDYYLEDRKFIQGLIQLSVSFLHLQNGNLTGARSLLEKCRNKFEGFNGDMRGINVDALKDSLETVAYVFAKLDGPEHFDWDLVPVLKG